MTSSEPLTPAIFNISYSSKIPHQCDHTLLTSSFGLVWFVNVLRKVVVEGKFTNFRLSKLHSSPRGSNSMKYLQNDTKHVFPSHDLDT